jgi:hypothetical protein
MLMEGAVQTMHVLLMYTLAQPACNGRLRLAAALRLMIT